MGRKYKANKFAQKRRERKQGADTPKTERPAAYQDIVKENEKFVNYYRHMKVCPETDWDEFIKTLQTDLPTTFRISGCRSTTQKLLEIIQNEFFSKYVAEAEGPIENPQKPFCLPWYPNNLAWQLDFTRRHIRRLESCYKLHNFLIAETATGSISRQEAVSMIPPLVLDVQSHHKVLDMCAAPGSKTAQLIETLHGSDHGSIPSGFVIANDVDNARCYMLVHQAKRLNSPCFMVINQDSTCMPRFRTIDDKDLKFDRILCDVPCSGDGTMRKNPDIWRKWHLGHALNLHGVQYRVVRRGAELLEIGGRLVYSTCSLNPVENEAVLHRLVKDSEGALEIVDASYLVPGLKYAPGMDYWELCDKNCTQFYKTFDEVPDEYRTVIRPQMFPPSKEDASQFSLNKCLRILPHFQNTGGFFVAALTKKRNLPWERVAKESNVDADKTVDVNSENPDDPEKSNSDAPQRKKPRRSFIRGFKEDPFVFFDENEPVWEQIKSFYAIDGSKLESFKPTQLLTRSLTGKKKNIYFCSDAVKQFVQANEQNVKIINTGVKVFARCDHRNMQCEFRMTNEGLDTMSNVIGEPRRIHVNKMDLISLLECTDANKPVELDKLSEKTLERLKQMESGSCLLIYADETGFELNVVGWKGAKSIRAYIDLNDSVHLLRLLGADVSKFEVNKFEKKNEEAIQAQQNPEEPQEPQDSQDMETN